MRTACHLCDGREHDAGVHFCRVCGVAVDVDRIRFTLAGGIACHICKVMVDGPDDEDDQLDA